MLKELLPFLKNVKAGLKSTILGIFLILFSSYLIYRSTEVFTIILESGLLGIGIVLLFLKDYQVYFSKKKEDEG